jgi:hypothetical protein
VKSATHGFAADVDRSTSGLVSEYAYSHSLHARPFQGLKLPSENYVSTTRLWLVIRFLLVALRSDSTSTLKTSRMKGVRAGGESRPEVERSTSAAIHELHLSRRKSLFDSGSGHEGSR